MATDMIARALALNGVADLKSAISDTFPSYASKNLYDNNKTTSGYLNSGTGAIEAMSGRKTSDYLPVEPGKYLTISRKTTTQALYNCPSICFFNANKTAISGGGTWKKALIVPAGAAYARVCIESSIGSSVQMELTDDGEFTEFAQYFAPYTELNEDIIVPSCEEVDATVDALAFDIADRVTFDYYSTYSGPYTSGSVSEEAVVQASDSYYYTNKIPVKPGYVLKGITENGAINVAFRYVAAYCGDVAVRSASNAYDSATYTVPEGIDGVILSIRHYESTPLIKIYGDDGETRYVIPQNPIGYMRVAGDMEDGTVLHVAENNVKNNVVVAFSGNITTFDTIYVGQMASSNSAMQDCYLEINDTNVIVHTDQGNATSAHGLTIANDIQVQIETEDAATTSRIRVVSSGEVYEDTTPHRWLCDVGFAAAVSDGSVLTDCALSWTSRNITKPIWVFGDSYVSLYPVRWVYYMIQDGFNKNCIINGYAGEDSANAKIALDNLLAITKPKYILWALGMNDADTDSAVNASWYSCYNYLIAMCKMYGITPILATIPNVPTANHSFKNAIIRSSGYRYIEFSKALDPDEDGDWISGALSADAVHPSEIGAKISYQRVLADFPEIVTL